MAVMLPFSRIVRFYLGTAPNYDGWMIGDLWQMSRSEIDASPRAFNWLFPMPDGYFLGGSLPLFREDIVNLRSHPTLQEHARKSYAWFTGIIGLSLADNGSITKGPSFLQNFDVDRPL